MTPAEIHGLHRRVGSIRTTAEMLRREARASDIRHTSNMLNMYAADLERDANELESLIYQVPLEIIA